MTTSQTFEILSRAGGIRAARIITENMPDLSGFRLWHVVWQLRRGVPVAKIIHKKWFFGLAFYTNRHTLDPRPDTETLVAAVIADSGHNATPRILDLGTGTGCIIISLVKNIIGARGTAIEKSRRAMRVARRNIYTHKLAEQITVRHGDLMRPIHFKEKFDVIVSNPPYIARGDARVDAGAMHDPKMSLYAAHDGFAAYESIAKNAASWIVAGGKIYLEIGIDMAPRVTQIFTDAGWQYVRAERDLGGIERVLVFTRF